MEPIDYIKTVLLPFVEAVKAGKAKKNFYTGWANAIIEHQDKDLTPPLRPPVEGPR